MYNSPQIAAAIRIRPYMLVVILCIIMYLWPGMTLWLPNYLYGNSS